MTKRNQQHQLKVKSIIKAAPSKKALHPSSRAKAERKAE